MSGLSKVTQYVKNVGKSVKYSAMDMGKDMSPSTASFVESNSDLFKDINYAIRNKRIMVNRVSDLMKKSKVYEAGDVALGAIFEDIRSGNFYNKERSEELNKKAFGFEDFDIEDGDDINVDSDDEPESELSVTSKASATAISETVARSSEYVVKNQRAISEYIMMQTTENLNKVNHNLTNINSNVSKVLDFATQGLKIHMENSKKFYEEVTPAIKEMNALLKESTEMNRNMYSNTAKKNEQERTKRIGYDDVMDSTGMPNVKEYFKAVMQNSKNSLGSVSGLGDMFGEDSNILLTLAASPLQFIPKMILDKTIDKKFKKSISRLDKSASGVFSNLMSRLNDMKYSDNKLASIIGDIFGLKNEVNTKIDSSKYEKGPIPWNGKANKALTEVIPQQLSKIVSLLSGQSETVYDYEKGMFVKANSVQKEYDTKIESAYKNATSDMRKEFEAMMEMYTFDKLENKKKFENDMDEFFKYFFTSGRHFDPKKDIDHYNDLAISSDNYDRLAGMFKKADRGTQMTFHKDIMEGRDSLTKSFNMETEKEDSIYRVLNNGFDVNEFFDKQNKSNKLMNDIQAPLLTTKDGYGNNVFFYLHKMTSTLLDGIKVYAMNGGAPSAGSARRGARNNKPNSGIDSILNRSTDLYNRDFEHDYDNDDKITDSMRESEKRRAERNKITKSFDDMDAKSFIADLSGELHDKKLIKERTEYHENQENKKDSWLDDLIGMSLSEKFQKLNESVKTFGDTPWDLVTKITDRIDLRLYEVMFGRDDKYYKGHEVKGFMDMVMVDLQNTFETFNDWMDEKVLQPLSGKIKGMDHEFLSNILRGFGIDISGKDIGTKIGNFIYGEKDDDGNYVSTGIISDIVDQTRNDLSSMKRDIVGVPGPIRKIIKLITIYCYDMSKHNEADSMVVLDQIYTEINKFNPRNSKDVGMKNKIVEIINNTEDADKTLRLVLTELKRAGYCKSDNLIGMLKVAKDNVVDYTVGTKNAFDGIEKIMYQSKIDGNRDLGRTKEIDGSKFMELHRILYRTMHKYNSNTPPTINQLISLVKNLLDELNKVEADNKKEVALKVKLFDILKRSSNVKSLNSSISKFTEELIKILPKEAGMLLLQLLPQFNKSSVNDRLQDELNAQIEAMNDSSFMINNIDKPFMKYDTVLDDYGNLNLSQFEFKNSFQKGLEDKADNMSTTNPLSVFDIGKSTPNTILEQLLMDMKNIPRHAKGLKNVPRDEYAALLHKGERVLTAEETEQQDTILPEILSLVENMNDSIKTLRLPNEEEYRERILDLVNDKIKDRKPTSEIEGAHKKSALDIINNADISTQEKLDQIMKLSNEDILERGPVKESLVSRMIFDVRSMMAQTRNVMFGTPSEDEEEVKEAINKDIDKVTKDVTSNFRDYLPKMGSGAIIGSGLGLIGGLVGGPLAWGAIGAGAGLLKSSGTVQEVLFGEVGKDGERSGGVIGKGYIDGFNKYAKSMKVNAIGGAALGLMGMTPFGVMGGILGGSALGFLKKNETTQNLLFGEQGALGPKVKKKLDSMMPRIALGALGGVAVGPFGLVGNVMLGSGLGMLSTSDKFKEMMLGKQDKDGKYVGGMFNWVKEKTLSSIYFTHHNLAKPIMKTLAPLRKEVGLIARDIKDGIIKSIDSVFEKFVGKPMGQFMDKYIFKPASTMFGGLFKGLTFGIRNIVAAPGKLASFAGNELRLKHIMKGEATYMTEEEKGDILLNYGKDMSIMDRFKKTMLGKTNRYKDSTEEEQAEAFWWRKKKKKEVSDEDTDGVKDEVKLTNTTLSELLGYVKDIAVHMGDKVEQAQTLKESNQPDVIKEANEKIDKSKEKASLLTPEGEIRYKRDYKGELVPEKGKAIDSIKTEQKNDNQDMDKLIELNEKMVDDKEEGNAKSGKGKSSIFDMFGMVTKFAPMLMTAIPALLAASPFIISLLKKIPGANLLMPGNSSNGEIEGGGVLEGGFEAVSQAKSNWKKNALNSVMWGKNIASRSARFLAKPAIALGNKGVMAGVKYGGRVARSIGEITPGVNKVISKVDNLNISKKMLVEGSESLLTKAFGIFKSQKVQKIIGKELAEKLLKMPQIIIKKAGPEVAKKIGSGIAKMFTGPLFIAIVIADILWGMDHADEVLRVEGDLPFRIRAIAGIIHALNQRFTFGLLPDEFMLTNVLKIVGTKDMKDTVAEGQALLKEHYEEFRKNNPMSNMSMEDYQKESSNNKSTFKWYNPFTWWGSNKSSEPVTRNTPRFGMGIFGLNNREDAANRFRKNMGDPSLNKNKPKFKLNTREEAANRFRANKGDTVDNSTSFISNIPFYSQKDSKWGKKPYNTSLDTRKQTIGNSGCGPAAAAMVTSGLTGKKITPDIAASYATKHKFKEKNGGTIPDFFKSFYGEYDLSANVDKLTGGISKGSKASSIINKIKQKKPVILMGKSSTKGSTPFGKNPHYVVALGVDDKGKLVVHDPEQSSGNTTYDLNNTIRKATYGISASNISKSILEGKKNKGLVNPETGELQEVETSTPQQEQEAAITDPIKALVEAGRLMVSGILGIPLGGDSDMTGTVSAASANYNYNNLPSDKVAFVKRLIPGAMKAYKETGLLPSISLAQACLESAWGTSGLSKTANNLFGMKAGSSWNGSVTTMSTNENTVDGKVYKIKAGFRKYNSFEESQQDYFNLMNRSRYDRVRQATDYRTAATMIRKCGYATDVNYEKKIISIIEKYKFHTLDSGGSWGDSNAGPLALKAVEAIKSRIGKNQYSQAANKRGRVGYGYGDCSSTVQWAYKQAGLKIGSTTATQVKQGKIVDRGPIMNDKMNVNNLRPGDLLFYKNKKYKPSGARPWGVGHVEMYAGNGQLIGHGSGKGPTVKDVTKYRRNEYILARRLNEDNGSSTPKFGMGSGISVPKPNIHSILSKNKTEKLDVPKFGLGLTKPKVNNKIDNKTNAVKLDNKPNTITTRYTHEPAHQVQNTSIKNSSNVNKPKSSKILEVFITLLKNIVENTSNLSQIVTLLGEGLNINIPESAIKEKMKGSPSILNVNQLMNDINKNNTESNELINLVNMIEEIALQ